MKKNQKIHKFERFLRDPHVGDNVLKPPMSGVACENIRAVLRMLGYQVKFGNEYDEELAKSRSNVFRLTTSIPRWMDSSGLALADFLSGS